jgi:hypothetical protein
LTDYSNGDTDGLAFRVEDVGLKLSTGQTIWIISPFVGESMMVTLQNVHATSKAGKFVNNEIRANDSFLLLPTRSAS